MSESERKPFIKEVILENFMSYDYGRIPLRSGLNVVLGPNGAGKSSILLGISVALGQAYTERSRRLSDLVKRGKDIARVTLLLDNSPRGGKRPLPFRSDLIHLSRYIRKDGTYWFEVDFKEASKIEVTETLRGLGLNPDNMLVIMHQGLGDAFSVVTPQEKLAMVEDAVGLGDYRKSLLEAKERLEKIRAEEEEREKDLQAASAGLSRWKEQFEKYLQVKELHDKSRSLRVEEAWSKVDKLTNSVHQSEDRVSRLQEELSALRARLKERETEAEAASKDFETVLSTYSSAERQRERLRFEQQLERVLRSSQQDAGGLRQLQTAGLISDETSELQKKVDASESNVADMLSELKGTLGELIQAREKAAVDGYRVSEMEKELRKQQKQLADLREEEASLKGDASILGGRPNEVRQLLDVQAELRVTELRIKELGDVPADAEAIYRDYKARIESLSARITELRSNKNATLREVSERFSVWKRELEALVIDLSKRYMDVLSMVGATGRVSLSNPDDPTTAGLEILVSFRGDQLVPLDAYVQSGGERSSAVTALLLALQGRVISPFRAVDEFDVHMDKLNRQLFMKSVYQLFNSDSSAQYVIITPVEPDVYDPNANYIMVHKVASSSKAGVAEKVAQR
ncbi:MAG: AAA family ATPase [Nitrososphaerota archaeon]|nr:AAA family ATPase [Nitrososphaerota archaeon]